jgi:hypothetical protein
MAEPFEFPEVFKVTDEASLAGQRAFVQSTRVQLILLVIASAAGSLSWTINGDWDGTALLAGVAFSVAAILRLLIVMSRPHRAWYDGRAAAESIKTLAWKHAVAGDPFVIGDASADERLVGLVGEVVSSFDTLGPDASAASAEPTPSMRTLRSASLEDRRRAYSAGRIAEQQGWYTRKAAWNKNRARLWGVIAFVLQVIGAVGAFLKGFGVIDIDLFGLAGAAVGSAVAWLETKQHHSIARAYKVAAEELADIQRLIDQKQTEREWSAFVAEAEEAISREHTLWRASSRSREPVTLA